jgi:hypothetical protein
MKVLFATLPLLNTHPFFKYSLSILFLSRPITPPFLRTLTHIPMLILNLIPNISVYAEHNFPANAKTVFPKRKLFVEAKRMDTSLT